MNRLLDYMGELQVNKDASGEPMPPQGSNQTHGVHGISDDLERAIPAIAFPARVQAMSECMAGWPEAYLHKLTTAEEALKIVKSGSVYIGGG